MNKRQIKTISILFLLLFALSGVVYAQKKPLKKPWIIIPGKSIGWVVIGKTDVRQVLSQFGKGCTINKGRGEVLYRKKFGLDFLYDKKTGKVTSVMITKPGSGGVAYVTRSGLMVGTKTSRLYKVMGRPLVIQKAGKFKLHTYKKEGRFMTFLTYFNQVGIIWMGLEKDYHNNIKRFISTLKRK